MNAEESRRMKTKMKLTDTSYLRFERKWARNKMILDTVMALLGCAAVGLFVAALLGYGAAWAWGGWR